MKQSTEKPSKVGMRFFTPELFIRFNSDDDEIADRADDAWEAAMNEYHSRLASFSDSLGEHLKEILRTKLHDADLVELSFPTKTKAKQPKSTASRLVLISLVQDDKSYVLIYSLAASVQLIPSPSKWPFSKKRVHWLYDELDMPDSGNPGKFTHRVLFSDGRVLIIPFVDAAIISRRVAPRRKSAVRQTA